MVESGYDGPEIYNYQIERDEYVAEDKDLCGAYEQLLKVILLFNKWKTLPKHIFIDFNSKDCEDLKYLMEIFSKELFVSVSNSEIFHI